MDKFKSESYTEQSHVIAYQIERMNKMIVAEQTYSDLYNHTSKKSLPGLTDIFSADKKVTLLVKAKAQATYDLKKMDIELDSVNKKLSSNLFLQLKSKCIQMLVFMTWIKVFSINLVKMI